jgi:hypothetical protein
MRGSCIDSSLDRTCSVLQLILRGSQQSLQRGTVTRRQSTASSGEMDGAGYMNGAISRRPYPLGEPQPLGSRRQNRHPLRPPRHRGCRPLWTDAAWTPSPCWRYSTGSTHQRRIRMALTAPLCLRRQQRPSGHKGRAQFEGSLPLSCCSRPGLMLSLQREVAVERRADFRHRSRGYQFGHDRVMAYAARGRVSLLEICHADQ